MRKIEVALTEQIAHELDVLKKTGWFKDDDEIIQLALMDFARLNKFSLAQQHAPEDCGKMAQAPVVGRVAVNTL